MKLNKTLFAALLAAAVAMVGCKEKNNIPSPGDNSNNRENPTIIPADTTNCTVVNVEQALEIIKALGGGEVTTERYKINGFISAIKTDLDDVPSSYTNITFTIKDATGKALDCYYTNGLNNRPFYSIKDVPLAGSKICVIGQLEQYESKSGTTSPEMVNGFISRIDSMVQQPDLPDCPEPKEGQISVGKSVEIALGQGGTTTEEYKVVGVVKAIASMDLSYGNAEFTITDGKKSLICYRTKGMNGAKFTSADQLKIGDIVVVQGKLQNFNGKAELAQGGKIIESNNPNCK